MLTVVRFGFHVFCLLALSLLIPLAPAPAADPGKSTGAVDALRAELAAVAAPGSELSSKGFASVPLTKADAAAARTLLVKAHTANIAKTRAGEIKDRLLKDGSLEMPFFIREFGKKPQNGRSLWISMHGGGGAPPKVNDSQYENQKKLYTLEEGLYLAPRAPTNTWNLWHESSGRYSTPPGDQRFRAILTATLRDQPPHWSRESPPQRPLAVSEQLVHLPAAGCHWRLSASEST